MLSDVRPPLDPFFALLGVPATVISLGSGEIDTVIIWERLRPDVLRATLGFSDQVVDIRPIVAIRRDAVPALPIGSTIRAPELAAGPIKTWIVNALTPQDPLDPEIFHAIVHEAA